MTTQDLAAETIKTLQRYVSHPDARKLDPHPLLELAVAGAEARGLADLAAVLAEDLAIMDEDAAKARGEAREELVDEEDGPASFDDPAFVDRVQILDPAIDAVADARQARDAAPDQATFEREPLDPEEHVLGQ